MRFLWASLIISSVTTVAFASLNDRPTSTLDSRDLQPLNPPESSIINHDLAAAVVPPLSNAKRLAAGLPPARPSKMWSQRERGVKAILPRTSGAACKSGFIRVNNGATVLGYLSLQLNGFGEYANVVPSTSDSKALKVCVSPASAVSGNSDVKALNSMVASLPWFGILQGYYSDITLNSTSSAYIFLGQTAQTAASALPGAPKTSPAGTQTSFGIATSDYEGYESNVWRVDASTGEMQLWWTNPDKTTAQVSILSVTPDNLFAGTGAPNAFAAAYGRTVTPVTFYYV